MPNFLAALGQSQAVSNFTQGLANMKQQELQARQGEQAIKSNDLAMQNTTQNMAIEKYKFDQIQAKDAADNKLQPMTDVLNTMGPKTQEAWKSLYGNHIEMRDNVPYIRAKNMETIMKGMQTPEVTAILDPIHLQDINDKLDKLNQLEQNLSSPDENGKMPKVDPQAMQQLSEYKAQTIKERTDLTNHLDAFNRRLDANKQEARRIELSKDFTPESVDAYIKSDGATSLIKIPKEATVTHSVPLGDKTRVYKSDGTYEDIPMGVKPGTKPSTAGKPEMNESQAQQRLSVIEGKIAHLKSITPFSEPDKAANARAIAQLEAQAKSVKRFIPNYKEPPVVDDVSPAVEYLNKKGTIDKLRTTNPPWSEDNIKRAAQEAGVPYTPPNNNDILNLR